MNSTYHLPAPSYDAFKKKLDKMLNEEDAALCCANIVWRPSQLGEYYERTGWEGEPLGKVFKNLGLQKASVMFYDLVIKKGVPEKDAWLEVYSKEVALN